MRAYGIGLISVLFVSFFHRILLPLSDGDAINNKWILSYES